MHDQRIYVGYRLLIENALTAKQAYTLLICATNQGDLPHKNIGALANFILAKWGEGYEVRAHLSEGDKATLKLFAKWNNEGGEP